MNKAEALQLLDAMAHDQVYGCYSRQGLELVAWPRIKNRAQYVIFADLDNIHDLNAELGYAEVDRRVRNALKMRSSDITATGRWYSGDEIVWIISEGDPNGLVNRLQTALEKQGLSATFGIVKVTSTKLAVNVEQAIAKVQDAKKMGERGSVR